MSRFFGCTGFSRRNVHKLTILYVSIILIFIKSNPGALPRGCFGYGLFSHDRDLFAVLAKTGEADLAGLESKKGIGFLNHGAGTASFTFDVEDGGEYMVRCYTRAGNLAATYYANDEETAARRIREMIYGE